MRSGLERFVLAQSGEVYWRALKELEAGHKRSHWMWFVFPQITGLGRSDMAVCYAIADRAEAKAYLSHSTLAPRLVDCTRAMLGWAGKRSAQDILGSVDAAKFWSSMTLFETAAENGTPFSQALNAFFADERDQATLTRL